MPPHLAVRLVLPLLCLLLGSCALIGCASAPPYIWYSELPPEPPPARMVFENEDKIVVTVDGHPELSGEFVVGTSGMYNHPLAGLVPVSGKSADAVAKLVSERLSRFIATPKVDVALVGRKPLTVTVLGEVRTPGTYPLPHGSGLLTALGQAGGLNDFADEDKLFILRASPRANRIRFRYSDLTDPRPGAVLFPLRDGDTLLVE